MELWLCARIDHRTVVLKNSSLQHFRICPPVYILADAGWHGITPGCASAASSQQWWWGRVGAGKTDGPGKHRRRPEQVVIHGDKSEHPVHYITSSLRGQGCVLMTFWWMTDSISIRSSDESQRDWTGQWPSEKLSAQGFKGNIFTQDKNMLMWFMSLKSAFSGAFVCFVSLITFQLNKCFKKHIF